MLWEHMKSLSRDGLERRLALGQLPVKITVETCAIAFMHPRGYPEESILCRALISAGIFILVQVLILILLNFMTGISEPEKSIKHLFGIHCCIA